MNVKSSALTLLCIAGLLFVFRERVLFSLGALCDAGELPQKADMIVVIGGDSHGNRILTAARLLREGYAPKILVSGVEGMYGHHESDLAINFAVEHGYPREAFLAFRNPALSTGDEALADTRELRRLGVHKYLLVTSEFHTARAGRIFRRTAKDMEEHTVAAPEPHWHNGRWWIDREGRKIWFNEAVKTVANYLGI